MDEQESKKYLHWSFFALAGASLFFGLSVLAVQMRLQPEQNNQKNISIEASAPLSQSQTAASPNIRSDSAASLDQSADSTPQTPPADNGSGNNAPSPAVSTAFSFAIIGDTQRFDPKNASGGFQQAVKSITAKKVDFLMTEGDLLSSCGDGCAEKLAAWKNILGPLVSKTYAMMGNHDRTGKNSSDSVWQNTFTLPTNGPPGYSELVYSFDFQNTHFVVLNSEKPKEHVVDETQRAWLEKDLAANKKENTFVFFHEPAYPVSSKIGESLDAEKDERDALWDILIRYKVAAVFNGHEHIHSRKKVGALYQFVFGNTDAFDHDLPKSGMAEFSYQGENFGIVNVAGRQITVNLYSVGGNLINSFKF